MGSQSTTIPFSKYHGCGNDFIMVWDPKSEYKTAFSNADLIKKMCNRFIGIGGDAVLYLTKTKDCDYEMVDYAAKYGIPSRLCGNGSRCSARFARDIGVVTADKGTFLACDGPHDFWLNGEDVSVKFADVLKKDIIKYDHDNYFIDVGSPHHMKWVDNIEEVDVMTDGRSLCFSDLYNKKDETGNAGANINFVQQVSDDTYRMRTYERTADEECPSCGTGSVATAIAVIVRDQFNDVVADGKTQYKKVIVNNAGRITITFTVQDDRFDNVILSGSAVRVFNGTYEI